MGAGVGGFGGGHVGGGMGGRVRHIGTVNGYPEGWMASTKKTIEDELKFRGIEPAIINEIVSKIEEPDYTAAIWISCLATALVLTVVFVLIWESTP